MQTGTRRLYWDDPLLLDAVGVVVRSETGRLVLDRTPLYPEAGGQLADHGTATWEGPDGDVVVPIVDAQVDGRGDIVHELDAPEGVPLPPAGAPVRVRVEPARRRLHMSLHTGQHMLSRALLDLAGAETVSSRLGATLCTIDTPLAALSDAAVADAEALVQAVVQEDRPVRALFPTAAELAGLPLRRDPKVTGLVRVIDVDGFDMSPCGGTHVVHTSQVGALHVVSVERYKGGHRVSFHAGRRALDDYARKDRALRTIMRATSSGVDEAPAAVARLEATLREARRDASELQGRLTRLLADALSADAQGGPVVALLRDEPVDLARQIALEIAGRSGGVAVIASASSEGIQVVALRGEGADPGFVAGDVIRRLAAATGGRGGGRPDRAEGRMPAGELAAFEIALAVERERLIAAHWPEPAA